MNRLSFTGKTCYYEGNSEGKAPTPDFYFTPPVGVRIADGGIVRPPKRFIPWEKNTRFYESVDKDTDEILYGTSTELADLIECSKSNIKTNAQKNKHGTRPYLYRRRYLIQEITMDEFFKKTGRFKREVV